MGLTPGINDSYMNKLYDLLINQSDQQFKATLLDLAIISNISGNLKPISRTDKSRIHTRFSLLVFYRCYLNKYYTSSHFSTT